MARQEDVEALKKRIWEHPRSQDASDALDELVAEVARLSAELDEARRTHPLFKDWTLWKDRAEAAEAELDEARRERDKALDAAQALRPLEESRARQRWESANTGALAAAEAERDALAQALRYIEWIHDGSDEPGSEHNVCPACGMTEARGHDGSCRTARALAAPAAPQGADAQTPFDAEWIE